LLLDYGATVDPPSSESLGNYRPLHAAAWLGKEKVIPILIAHGANPNTPMGVNPKWLTIHGAPSSDGASPLHLACGSYCAEHVSEQIVEDLLKAGANPNRLSFEGKENALHFASQIGNNKAAQLLLNAKCNPTLKSHAFNFNTPHKKNGGRTPIEEARSYGHSDTIQILERFIKKRDVIKSILKKKVSPNGGLEM
jgi:ankyrin repeat protein